LGGSDKAGRDTFVNNRGKLGKADKRRRGRTIISEKKKRLQRWPRVTQETLRTI